MRIKLLLILTALLFLFGVRSAFAVTVTISNTPTEITDQHFSMDIQITGAFPATNYLRADFFQPNTTKYFGYTYNGSDWYNGSDYSQYLPVAITSSGYSGTLQAKIDTSSSRFQGNGTYNLRIRRYTQSGNYTPNESNIVSLNVNLTSSTPTPSSTSNPSPTSSSPSSLFSISNTPSQVNSDQSFNVTVNLNLPNDPNTNFFLKGAFKKSDSSNYFGLTKVEGIWVKNSVSYTNQYKITTDSSGNWSGTLEVKVDMDDSGFTGSGDYIFKVGRYKQSDNPSVVWSNESDVNITAAQSTPSPSSAPKPSSPPNSSNNSPTSSKSNLTKTASTPKFSSQTASIAGVIISATPSATPASSPSIKNQKQSNPLLWLGGIFVIIGLGLLSFLIFKSRLRK